MSMDDSAELRRVLLESLDLVLADLATPERVQAVDDTAFDAELWQQMEALGFSRAPLPEDAGGVGLGMSDFCALLEVCGRHAAPVPLLESAGLAGWMLAASGAEVPDGLLCAAPSLPGQATGATGATTAPRVTRDGAGWRLDGVLEHVPHAAFARWLVLLADGPEGPCVARLDLQANPPGDRERGNNMAGEGRDRIDVTGMELAADDVMPAGPGVDAEALLTRGALGRVALMSGALQRALELSLNYATERKQFGRPLSKFQAIQQQLALLAAEASAVAAALQMAAQAVDAGGGQAEVAAAKIRAGRAVGAGCRIAHQVHGAMGFTQEYPLHHVTRRLWSWRDEYGTESYWARRLGRAVAAHGAQGFWPYATQAPGSREPLPAA